MRTFKVALPARTAPAGHVAPRGAETVEIPAESIRVEEGHLVLQGPGSIAALFAPGRWVSAREVK